MYSRFVSHVVCLLLMGKLLRPHSTVPCSVMFMALVELSPLAFINVACALFHVVQLPSWFGVLYKMSFFVCVMPCSYLFNLFYTQQIMCQLNNRSTLLFSKLSVQKCSCSFLKISLNMQILTTSTLCWFTSLLSLLVKCQLVGRIKYMPVNQKVRHWCYLMRSG